MNNSKTPPDWSFQDNAVANIVNDFKKDNLSRNLLIIPTGGGKTLTAIRSVNKLLKSGFFKGGKKAMWIVHTKALRDQTEDEIIKEPNVSKFKLDAQLKDVLEVRMKTKANEILSSTKYSDYKLLIIDEAHHSAAATYKNFFDIKIGILGLTATPSRTDKQELDFKKVSYSITFRELENRRVILVPEFVFENTEMIIDTDSISFDHNVRGLEKFNTEERNDLIAKRIIALKKRYKLNKIIVFVGTNDHVVALHRKMNTINKALGNQFDHIGYIYGGDHNEMGISNEDYLDKHKNINNSVLINCRILNEGYDDPVIDTVVMATPTSSMLYYMQCIGRVVRSNSSGRVNKARVVEMIDRLPNVMYKIDNRWLYSEISDYLEPEIIDTLIIDERDYKRKVSEINRKYRLKIEPNNYQEFDSDSLLVFNSVPQEDEGIWGYMFFSGEDREKYISIFNNISDNIDKYYEHRKFDWVLNNILKIDKDDKYFCNRDYKIGFFTAMNEAYCQKNNKEKVTGLKYITFRKRKINWLYKLWRIFIGLFINN